VSQHDRDVDTLARTLWGEARGEGLSGMEAVACVILNRLAVAKDQNGFWWGDTVEKICRKSWQFSCWNENDPNSARLKSLSPVDIAFRAALDIAEDAIDGLLVDMTHGATHYLNPKAVDIKPAWATGKPLAVIGKHHFYRPPEVPKPKQKEKEPCLTTSPPTPENSSPSLPLWSRLLHWLRT